MSHIFDALQRSEADRAGSDVSALPGPTELLERAERKAAERWDADPLAHLHEGFEPSGSELSFGLEDRQAAAAAAPATATQRLEEKLRQLRPLDVLPAAESRLVSLTEPAGPAAEAFRLLGVRLRDIRRERKLAKVLITSTIPQEGKSLITANLACTLASGGQQRVLVVEGDLRRPSLAARLGLKEIPGLCECLEGNGNLVDHIYYLETAGFWMIPAGGATSNVLELMQSKRLSAMLDQLSAWFDWVLIDSPPVIPLADTSIWARMADGILLVTHTGVTEKKMLRKGLAALDPQKLIGAVMNYSRIPSEMDYYYGSRPAQ